MLRGVEAVAAAHSRRRRKIVACIGNRMTRDVVAVEASVSCAEAARVMSTVGIGSVGVREAGRLVGLVTERDLVAAVAAGRDPARTEVRALVRDERPSMSPCATDLECAAVMRAHRTRHVLVKEGAEIVGVVSLLDLVDLVVEEKEWRIDQLESYIGGGRCRQLSEPVCTAFGRKVEAA
jgi:CBS domain-containing protein